VPSYHLLRIDCRFSRGSGVADWGAWAPAPAYRGLWATTPERPWGLWATTPILRGLWATSPI
jgi:hypothetical protein